MTDNTPGITRRTRGQGFVYNATDGKTIRDPEELARIKALAIPPAWQDVWICSVPHGHLQATGRDARGRKQHRYHPRWHTVRDENKYERVMTFAKVLPTIRRQVDQDLALPGLPRDKVLATVIRLLETTFIRVGNEEYARQNGSFGLATLRDRHVNVSGSNIRFDFHGKSGVEHAIDLNDRRIAKVVKRCQDLPGYELFQYIGDDGERCSISSTDVNDYLRRIAGDDFSTKDFRTWAGTVLAARALREFQAFDSQAQAKRNVVQAIESVAKKLGNTKAVCRKCYIHPAIIDSYTDGSLLRILRPHRGEKSMEPGAGSMEPGRRREQRAKGKEQRGRKRLGKRVTESCRKLTAEEMAVLSVLKKAWSKGQGAWSQEPEIRGRRSEVSKIKEQRQRANVTKIQSDSDL